MAHNVLETLIEWIEDHAEWRERMEDKMSKLSDAVSALELAVNDLKTRSANENSALQTALDAANAESAAATDKLTAITAAIAGVDVPPVVPAFDPSPPVGDGV